MEMQDRTVVVTGGASGIGKAMAERFTAENPRGIVVADLNADGAEAVANGIAAIPTSTAQPGPTPGPSRVTDWRMPQPGATPSMPGNLHILRMKASRFGIGACSSTKCMYCPMAVHSGGVRPVLIAAVNRSLLCSNASTTRTTELWMSASMPRCRC